VIEGITRTKDININTPEYWNSLCSRHGGGERDDLERFNPIVEEADGSVLDVGCFFGHLFNHLYESGCTPVVGIDISLEAIKRARKNYPSCIFIVAKADALPFRDLSFDTVTSAETLEHLDDYKIGLAEAERVGKKIVFSVPKESIYTEHVWTFTRKGVENLLEKKHKSYVKSVANNWIMGVYYGK